MSKSNSTSKSFIILSIITIVEKVLSFVYQAMIAGMIGANSISDAYFTSAEFYTLIDSTLLSALVIVLLNTYTKQTAESGIKKAESFLTNILRIVLPITLLLAGVLFVFAYPLSFIIGPGYNDEGREILAKNLKFMSIVPVFLSLTSICLAVLRQEKKFLIVGLKSLYLSTSGIIFVLIAHFTAFPKTNILCLGYILAYFLYMTTVCISVNDHHIIKFGFPTFGIKEKALFKMLIPLVISNGILKVSMMIDKIICSTVGEGAVSCLTYSHTLYYFVEALFVTNLSTILLSDFNELSSKGLKKEIAQKMSRTLSIMTLALMPITIITIIYRYDIVEIVFMRGTFMESDVFRVGNLIMIYSIGFVPSVISNIYMQVYYAEGKTNITMKYSLISIGINITASVLLSQFIGLNGIAIGTVVSVMLSIVLYKRRMHEYVTEYIGFIDLHKLYKLLLASITTVAITYLIHTFAENTLLSFLLAAIIGVSTFISIMVATKDEISLSVVGLLLKKLKLKSK